MLRSAGHPSALDAPGLRERLLTVLLRPTAPPLGWGIATAVVLIAAELLIVRLLAEIAPDSAFGAVLLFAVLVVSAGWGFRLAVSTSVASVVAYAWVHAGRSSESLVPAVVVFSTLALLTNVLVGQSRLRAAESDQRRRETAALARQQTSLRRVATLVALRTDLGEICAAVATELADGIGAEHVSLVRYDDDGSCTVLAARDGDAPGPGQLAPGERLPTGGHNVSTLVLGTGATAVIDYDDASGPIAERARRRGLRLGVGVPVTVDGRIWGAVVIASSARTQITDVEARLSDFADLVATAVYNSETRDQLTRSRARVIAAADQARRAIERDLHDGAQQRIVSLGMDLRATQAAVPAELGELRGRLDRSVELLAALHTDLQELSRGIHPAILSRGGLAPALKTLARRSPVPVALSTTLPARLPDPVEVAAYYVVAEALTNTAKYANAAEVTITALADDAMLRLVVSDDGAGGARTDAGSGLLGLQDRVEAVGGTLTVSSPAGAGTTLDARFPLATTG